MSRAQSFASEARRALVAIADPEVKAGAERYFKGAVPFLGVRAPKVRELFRRLVLRYSTQPIDTLLAEAFALLRSPHQEEKQLAVHLLERVRRDWPATLLAQLEPHFDAGVHDWATCDGVSGRVLRVLLDTDSGAAARLVRWSRSANPWRQRASAVAFVKVARHGAHTATILEICRRLTRSPDRFVQLGMGWALRELYLAAPDAVLALLREHLSSLRREAVRYAIEKMPARVQSTVLAEHAAAQGGMMPGQRKHRLR